MEQPRNMPKEEGEEGEENDELYTNTKK